MQRYCPIFWSRRIILLTPLHHWWLYHRLFPRDNGGLMGLHEAILLTVVLNEMTPPAFSPSKPLLPERADRGAMGSAVTGPFRGAIIIWRRRGNP